VERLHFRAHQLALIEPSLQCLRAARFVASLGERERTRARRAPAGQRVRGSAPAAARPGGVPHLGKFQLAAMPPLFAALAALAFLRFATSVAFAAAESFRFGAVLWAGVSGARCLWNACQRFFCASAILARAAALIFRRFRFVGAVVAADSLEPSDSMARSSAIWRSIFCFWDSKPWMAAAISSVVSLCVGMSALCTIHGSAIWSRTTRESHSNQEHAIDGATVGAAARLDAHGPRSPGRRAHDALRRLGGCPRIDDRRGQSRPGTRARGRKARALARRSGAGSLNCSGASARGEGDIMALVDRRTFLSIPPAMTATHPLGWNKQSAVFRPALPLFSRNSGGLALLSTAATASRSEIQTSRPSSSARTYSPPTPKAIDQAVPLPGNLVRRLRLVGPVQFRNAGRVVLQRVEPQLDVVAEILQGFDRALTRDASSGSQRGNRIQRVWSFPRT
jgi:hypothetical protein